MDIDQESNFHCCPFTLGQTLFFCCDFQTESICFSVEHFSSVWKVVNPTHPSNQLTRVSASRKTHLLYWVRVQQWSLVKVMPSSGRRSMDRRSWSSLSITSTTMTLSNKPSRPSLFNGNRGGKRSNQSVCEEWVSVQQLCLTTAEKTSVLKAGLNFVSERRQNKLEGNWNHRLFHQMCRYLMHGRVCVCCWLIFLWQYLTFSGKYKLWNQFLFPVVSDRDQHGNTNWCKTTAEKISKVINSQPKGSGTIG